MKHLKVFESLQESENSPTLIGFAFDWDGVLHVGAAYTFREFAIGLGDYFSYDEDEDPPMDFASLRDLFSDNSDELSSYESSSYAWDNCTMWWGLIPRNNRPFISQTGGTNPYSTVRELEELFSNSKEVFSKHLVGNEEDLGYITQSIDNDPSQLEAYYNFLSEDDFNKVLDGLKNSMGDKELKGLIAFYQAKRLS